MALHSTAGPGSIDKIGTTQTVTSFTHSLDSQQGSTRYLASVSEGKFDLSTCQGQPNHLQKARRQWCPNKAPAKYKTKGSREWIVEACKDQKREQIA